MNLNDYQKQALTTALYSDDSFKDLVHWVLGISGEAGEISEKIKKIIRDKDGQLSAEDKDELIKEVGDVLWYLAVLCDHLGYSLEDAAERNLAKLKSRKERDNLRGSGDNR